MKNKFYILAAFGMLLFVVLGCSAIRQIPEMLSKTQKPKDVISTDGKAQLTIPSNWRVETGLNDEAILQVSNQLQEQYAIVLPDDKKDFAEKPDLQQITDLIKDNLKQSLTDTSFSEPVSLTINGYPALQFEVTGKAENIRAKYLLTMVDTPDTFYQIMCWSLESMFEANKKKLLDVSNSFKLIADKSADAPPPPSSKKPTFKNK